LMISTNEVITSEWVGSLGASRLARGEIGRRILMNALNKCDDEGG
jgi:hypothetical protein